jgi:hypothetical protein
MFTARTEPHDPSLEIVDPAGELSSDLVTPGVVDVVGETEIGNVAVAELIDKV